MIDDLADEISLAVEERDTERLKQLMLKEPNLRTKEYQYILIEAIETNRIEIVEIFLDYNPKDQSKKLDINSEENKLAVLTTIATRGDVEIFDILLENGFDINAADITGLTALHVSVKLKDISFFNKIMEKNPILDSRCEDNEEGYSNATPLHLAALYRDEEDLSTSLANIKQLTAYGAVDDPKEKIGFYLDERGKRQKYSTAREVFISGKKPGMAEKFDQAVREGRVIYEQKMLNKDKEAKPVKNAQEVSSNSYLKENYADIVKRSLSTMIVR